MDFVSLSRCPEFLYASRRFESFFRQVLNGIERKHQEFLHVKRIELLEEIEQLKMAVARAKPAKGSSQRVTVDQNREARIERLKIEFKGYSEALYQRAWALLRSEALAIRTVALNHFRQRNPGNERAVHELSMALDKILNTSNPTFNAAELFKCPLYHEGFCRLNPIDLTK